MHRSAGINDLEFIYDQIMDGAKYGYFNRKSHQIPAIAKKLKLELTSILKNKVRLNGLSAYGVIYELNDECIGFIIMSVDKENKGDELWMAAIHPDYRNKGHGKKMITEVLEQLKESDLIITARCAPESEAMYQILLQSGFRHLATSKGGYRGLAYEGQQAH